MDGLGKDSIKRDIESIKEDIHMLEDCINFYQYVVVNISKEEQQRFIEEYKKINPETKIFDPLN